MHRNDFLKLIGTEANAAEYLPVAGSLRNGNGFVGRYNATMNVGLAETCMLVNARIFEFKEGRAGGRGSVQDFNDFLEEVVARVSVDGVPDALAVGNEDFGKAIPLTAIAMDEITIVYPVSHIRSLLERASKVQSDTSENTTASNTPEEIPSFLDFEQSPVLKVLRTKLW
ncbi:hypothetical protein CA54_13010 [Symmachiella macrocystis]|uniref:Uncharacterized protein n=1 Tax=Symmachiella macrocystis TaxID=2527985 RepID=A0A5C6BLC8_9PLAN|nr:hypothetical protein [Symmachiella macrocystis]TWU12477.1 hypothetical protein CA54_13010 [Symmachiella macrocystis]